MNAVTNFFFCFFGALGFASQLQLHTLSLTTIVGDVTVTSAESFVSVASFFFLPEIEIEAKDEREINDLVL